jgi:hypothetical protein
MREPEKNKMTLEGPGATPVSRTKLDRIAEIERASAKPLVRRATVDIDRLDAATRQAVLDAVEAERVEREAALRQAASAVKRPHAGTEQMQVDVVAPDGQSYPAGDGRTVPYAV